LPAVHHPKPPIVAQTRVTEETSRLQSQMNHDSRHRVVDLPPLSGGDKVYIRDTQTEGEVLGAVPGTPRSYNVQEGQGSIIRRNRRSLIATPTDQKVEAPSPTNSPSPVMPYVTRSGRVVKPREKLDL